MRWPFVSRARYDALGLQLELKASAVRELQNELTHAGNELSLSRGALRDSSASEGRFADRVKAAESHTDSVSRQLNAALDVARADLLRESAARVAAESRLEGVDARYADLLEKYHALKLAGAAPPPPVASRAEPDPVTQAMIQKARGSPILMKQFRDYVYERRAANVMEADIAAEIRAGVEDMEGVP